MRVIEGIRAILDSWVFGLAVRVVGVVGVVEVVEVACVERVVSVVRG